MNRREVLKSSGAALIGKSMFGESNTTSSASTDTAERWGIFELTCKGPKGGNPFLDVTLNAVFKKGNRKIAVDGFYDGDGVYKVRFMPDELGVWEYETNSNTAPLNGLKGTVLCVKPQPGNHGPVSVRNSYHFGYADGTPYFPFGTTCYAWVHQTEELQTQTLQSLRSGPFNKIRMCIFPKWYQYNHATPPRFPFSRTGETNDYTRFNPEFFRHIEGNISDLRALNIEADLILFHP